MRSPVVFGTIAVLLGLAGCSSTASVDDLGIPRPSLEITNSIPKPQRPVAQTGMRAGADILVRQTKPRQEDQIAEMLDAPSPALEAAPRRKPVQIEQAEQPVIQASAYQMARVHGPKFRDAEPISFGSVSPRKFQVHGVDVSRWQGNINWSKLRAQGANFAYIKATDGGDHIDPMFRKNWKEANEAGMRRGAYHFFYWCRTGAEQAEWFIRNVPKSASALPPVIDVEYNHGSRCKKRPSRELVLKKMKTFMDTLEAHYGQRPIIYTAPDFYEDNLQGEFGDHAFWLRSTAQHPRKTYPDRKWLFWQYSGTGLSHGVRGEIDLNVFNGDPASWNRWLARSSG
jgi:lysozyme